MKTPQIRARHIRGFANSLRHYAWNDNSVNVPPDQCEMLAAMLEELLSRQEAAPRAHTRTPYALVPICKAPDRHQLDADIELIHDTALQLLVRTVLDRCPSCFWTMPASTSGKYHPVTDMGPGGLIRHTRAVVRITRDLLTTEGIEPGWQTYDICISAAILHDCCRKNDNEQHSAWDHPLRAARLIMDTAQQLRYGERVFGLSTAVYSAISGCVATHMGRWNTNPHNPSDAELPTPRNDIERLVHRADYLASRKHIIIPPSAS